MISHSVIIITKGKEEEGVKVREEEGKACCSLRQPGLLILHEPQLWGEHTLGRQSLLPASAK
jgi:hypothetical protein